MNLPYSVHGNNWQDTVLEQLQRIFNDTTSCRGVCARIGWVHNYEFQEVFTQAGNFTAQYEIWNDGSEQSDQGKISFDIDLDEVIDFINGDQGKRRIQEAEMDNSLLDTRGRFAYVFVVVEGKSGWISCRRPFENVGLDCVDKLHLLMDKSYKGSA